MRKEQKKNTKANKADEKKRIREKTERKRNPADPVSFEYITAVRNLCDFIFKKKHLLLGFIQFVFRFYKLERAQKANSWSNWVLLGFTLFYRVFTGFY